jgi:hypothetical protein
MVNMKKITILMTIFLLAAVTVVSCAKPPEEEMNAAEAALSKAQNDPNAVQYGAIALKRAQNAATTMRQAASEKRYDDAKIAAQTVVSAAEQAIADGKKGAAAAKSAADQLLNSVKAQQVETRAALDKAKEASLVMDYDAAEGNMTNAQTKIDQGSAANAQARYTDGTTALNDARSLLTGVQDAVSAAVAPVSRKK